MRNNEFEGGFAVVGGEHLKTVTGELHLNQLTDIAIIISHNNYWVLLIAHIVSLVDLAET